MQGVLLWTGGTAVHRLAKRHKIRPPWCIQPWSADGNGAGGGVAPVLSARCGSSDQPLDRNSLRLERLRGPARSRARRRPRNGERRTVALPVHRDDRLLRDVPVAALVHAPAAHSRHGRGDGSRSRACGLRPVGRGALCGLRRALRLCRRRPLFHRDDGGQHRRAGEAQHRHEHQHVGGRRRRHRLGSRPRRRDRCAGAGDGLRHGGGGRSRGHRDRARRSSRLLERSRLRPARSVFSRTC